MWFVHIAFFLFSQITDIIHIAKINFVVMNLLANGHKKDSTSPPEFDFSISKYFPVIKLNWSELLWSKLWNSEAIYFENEALESDDAKINTWKLSKQLIIFVTRLAEYEMQFFAWIEISRIKWIE